MGNEISDKKIYKWSLESTGKKNVRISEVRMHYVVITKFKVNYLKQVSRNVRQNHLLFMLRHCISFEECANSWLFRVFVNFILFEHVFRIFIALFIHFF